MKRTRAVPVLVAIALAVSLVAALWGSSEQQRTLGALLRNINHAVWAGVGAKRIFGRH